MVFSAQQPSLDMTRLLSRTPGREADKRNTRDEWGKTHGSGIWLTGRTVLNMWRLMRSELKLCSYTLQVMAYADLRVGSSSGVPGLGVRRHRRGGGGGSSVPIRRPSEFRL